MMINLINLPIPTTTELQLSELPPILETEIKAHFYNDETPSLCLATRQKVSSYNNLRGDLIVQAITPHRVVRIICNIEVREKSLWIDDIDMPISIILRDFVGFRRWRTGDYFYLEMLTHSGHDLSFVFASIDWRLKFSDVVLSSIRRLGITA